MDDNTILVNRIVLPLDVSAEETVEHKFQNMVLRPILKSLNSKIVAFAKEFIPKLINIKDDVQRRVYVKENLNKNIKLVNHLCGMTSAYFTTEEFTYYLENYNNINKRIKNMCIERIASNL